VLHSFIRDGLDRGEKAVHIVDSESQAEYLKRLADCGRWPTPDPARRSCLHCSATHKSFSSHARGISRAAALVHGKRPAAISGSRRGEPHRRRCRWV
jgi:hypothetical protein